MSSNNNTSDVSCSTPHSSAAETAEAITLKAHLPFKKVQMPEDYMPYTVTVSGGQGGHCATDIHRGRANAIKILANLLLVAIRQCDIKLYIVHLNGGTDATAIPDKAVAKIIIPKDKAVAFETLSCQCGDAIKLQFNETDPEVSVSCEPSVWHSTIVSEEGTHLVLASLNGIPVGAVEVSQTMKDTPLTSNNIGIVEQTAKSFEITVHTQGTDKAKMENLSDQIRRIFVISGAKVDSVKSLP